VLVVDDRDRGEPRGLHGAERFDDRGGGLAGDGLAADHRLQRLEERALLDGALREILAELAERLLQDARERLGAELRERRRGLAQRVEVGARELVAEDVLGRLEVARAPRACRERRDGLFFS
jgi:hypothetical protein